MELCGERAARYIDNIRAAFEPNLEPGMQRIARMMSERQARSLTGVVFSDGGDAHSTSRQLFC
jgi:hypothetical protein